MFTHRGAGIMGCYGNTVSPTQQASAAGGQRKTDGTMETHANRTQKNQRMRKTGWKNK